MATPSIHDPSLDFAKSFFILRGAFGFKEYANSIQFKEALENATEPVDFNKVSSLSTGQINILNHTSAGRTLIPLLNRMGELGMMDFRKGLVNPTIVRRTQNSSQVGLYSSMINAYQKSI